MFDGRYYAQKKVGKAWVPTTTVLEGETYRHWDPEVNAPASDEIVASQYLTIDLPIFVAEMDDSTTCRPCGRPLTNENTKTLMLPGHKPEKICLDCFCFFVKMAKENLSKESHNDKIRFDLDNSFL